MPIVVAFVSQKGGVGKSTLARALAVVATSAHLKVKLADLDPLQRTLLMWMKRRNQKNVEPAVLVEGFANFDEAWDSAGGGEGFALDCVAVMRLLLRSLRLRVIVGCLQQNFGFGCDSRLGNRFGTFHRVFGRDLAVARRGG